jgi:hypothetical protein
MQPVTSANPTPVPLAERVATLTRRTEALWWACDLAPLPPLPTFERQQHDEHALALDRFVAHVRGELRARPRSANERQALQRRTLAAFAELARAALGFEQRHLDLLSGGFMPTLAAFSQAARRFDAAISGADIFQAGRNVSILNGLQVLLGAPVGLTPAITAYSLLYPYTDNYLDDPSVSAGDKAAFNTRFGRRLAGQPVEPANRRESAIYALVGMIEAQYPRASYPEVHGSLLAIHHAQERSVELLRGRASPYEVDVLGISVEKGGASVLADGYLVAGTLTPAQEEFLFGWGAFLQLADDLQDVRRDARAGLTTIFSQTAGRWPLDALSTRTLHLGLHVLQRAATLAPPQAAPLVELMQRSAVFLVLDAVGQSRALHTRTYALEVERRLPFRFAALDRARRTLARRAKSGMGVIEAFASAEDG